MKSNKIEINKASLVSLKAELLRKQDEVKEAKLAAQTQYIRPTPRPKKETILTKKNIGVDKRSEKDAEEKKEEEDILKKSRKALEAKSRLYDKLSKDSTVLSDNDAYLVNFEEKSFERRVTESCSHTESAEADPPSKSEQGFEESECLEVSDSIQGDEVDDDGWVEYIDCLGRTRRCLKEDLDFVKNKDIKLAESLGYLDQKKEDDPVKDEKTKELELVSGDMKREMMRQKWEEQEVQLRDKKNIHYQDVLFDEARAHGVGYYAFSSDETLRAAEQEALAKLRQETEEQQQKAQAARDRRQQMLNARLKAARQRKRARLGLPPEEEEPEEIPEETVVLEEPKKLEVEEDPSIKPVSVRPWDIGKEGVTETSIMTQEEWVKKRRLDRPEEFAPPQSYQIETATSYSSHSNTSSFESTTSSSTFEPTNTLSFESIIPPFESTIPFSTFEPNTSRKTLFFTTKNTASTGWKKKYPVAQDKSSSDRDLTYSEPVEEIRKGVEIPPPPTFNYYGPSSSSSRHSGNTSTKDEVESAIMAGLKYLRQKAEEKEKQSEKGLLDIM